MTDSTISANRTYGGWRRHRTVGLGSLSLFATLVLFAGAILSIVALAVGGLAAAVPVAGLTGVVLVPMVVHDRNGRTALQAIVARVAWAQGYVLGAYLYRSGPLSRIPTATCSLPGLAANLQALEAVDGAGRPFGLLFHPNVGHVSAVLSTKPDSTALVDPDQVDQWVGSWARFLADLGHEPALAAVAVTISSAPELGRTLRAEIDGQMDPAAPPLARAVLTEIADTYPAGTASVTSKVTLTFSTAARPGQHRRSVEEMAADVGSRLPNICRALAGTGAGETTPMTVAELAADVRVAFDPAAHAHIDQLDPNEFPCPWSDCGPIGSQETFSTYRHDSGLSVSWTMSEAPRGMVFASVLSRLLAPSPAIPRKRVTIVYRPFSAADATKVVERGRRDSLFASQSRKIGRARDAADFQAAEQSAAEEASGAGVLRFGLLVTATVLDPADLAGAVNAVDNLATTSRIRLRRAYGSQSSTFLAALGLVSLPAHLKVPGFIRDTM